MEFFPFRGKFVWFFLPRRRRNRVLTGFLERGASVERGDDRGRRGTILRDE